MIINWDAIKRAVEILSEGQANRLDGKGWTVYKVGNIIRVDIKEK